MFERKPLRADVAAEIQGRIIDGRLPAGIRINESLLADELGISRTPLREAMLCLDTEGVLTSDMGRGFRVPLLEADELQDILGALNVALSAAVRHGADDDIKSRLEARNLLNRARMQSAEPALFCEQLYLLMRHLVAGCYNRILRRECLRLTRLTLRYLFVGMSRGAAPLTMLNHIETALADLDHHDRAAAAGNLGQALAELSRELAPRFPTEDSGQA